MMQFSTNFNNLYLNNQPFENDPDNFIKDFAILLSKKEEGVTATHTVDGISGYTLFCTTKLLGKGNSFLLYPFVIKISRIALAKHEIFGRDLINRCGIRTPKMKITSNKVNHMIPQIFEAANKRNFLNKNLEAAPKEYSITVMEQIQGMNLKSFFSHPEKIKNVKDWSHLQKEIGKVTVLDGFIGNDDRIIEAVGGVFRCRLNMGNFMVTDAKQDIVCIDNTPSRPFTIQYGYKSIDDQISNLEIQLTQRTKQNQGEVLLKRQIIFLNQKKKERQNSIKPYFSTVESYTNAFQKIIKGSQTQELVDAISKDFLRIFNECFSQSEGDREDFINHFKKDLKNNFLVGMEEGLKILKEKASQGLLNINCDELSEAFLQLINENILILKNSSEKC